MSNAETVLRLRVTVLLGLSGRTRRELAAHMGKSPSWSTEYLQGKHSIHVRDLDRIAAFFGLTVSQLFDGDARKSDRRRWDRRDGGDRRGK